MHKAIHFGTPKTLISVVLLLFVCLALAGASPSRAQSKAGAKVSSASLPSGMDVEKFMAGLSDEQVRRILLDELKKQAEKDKQAASALNVDQGRKQFMKRAKFLAKQFEFMLSGFGLLHSSIPWAVSNLEKAPGSPGVWGLFVLLVTAALTGLALEFLVRHWTRNAKNGLAQTEPKGSIQLFSRLVSMLGLELFYALLFLLGYAFASVVVGRFSSTAGQVNEAFATSFIYLRIFLLIASFLVAPGYPHLRLVPLGDDGAAFVRRTVIIMSLVGFFFGKIGSVLSLHGLAEPVAYLFGAGAAFNVTTVLIAAIYLAGDRLSLPAPGDQDSKNLGLMRGLASAYLLLLYVFWLTKFLMAGPGIIVLYFGSVALLPIFMALDRMAKRLCQTTFEGPSESEGGHAISIKTPVPVKSMSTVTHRVVRGVLIICFIMLLAEIWNLMPKLSNELTKPVLTVGFTLFAGYLLWGTTRYYILKRIADDSSAEGGEDGFGAGGDRMQTLMDLFRKFISVLVFSVCTLVVLSALGVDIAPLVAGAGVLGLAVGFGAQTLVKDIVSGIFFLIDDAFRVGDYVSAGSSKGTVEAITIRSLRLRHHLGMVLTIPYGSLGSVTNFTRDWIITKIQLRVPFDTDLKKVKKIVKKINKMIQENEEMGHNLLAPIKSQGVKKLDDDSALVVRIKFMTKPGTQFLIKREIYRLVQKLFAKEGIEFAARKVMVQVPAMEPNGSQFSPEQVSAIGAAAVAEEERRKGGDGPGKKSEALDI